MPVYPAVDSPPAAFGGESGTTTNSYVDLVALPVLGMRQGHCVIKNTGGTNGLHSKVLGSVDGGASYPIEIAAEGATAAGANRVVSWTLPYTHVKVQIKAQVAASQTTAQADIVTTA